MNMSWALALSISWSLVGWSAPAFATDWVTMHQYEYGRDLREQVSFQPQPDEAALQLKLMGYSDSQADELEEQLTLYLDDNPDTKSVCHSATSKEGTMFSDLGVNRAGELPKVAYNQTQRLGADVSVIECRISGIGTPVYWFYDREGYYLSAAVEGPCNNIGVVAPPPPRVMHAPKPTPKAAQPPANQQGSWGVMNVPPRVVHIDDYNVCGCVNVPGFTTIIPGSNLQPADWD